MTGGRERPQERQPASPKPPRAGGGRKLSFKEQRELEGLPARIAALEDEQQRLKTESGSAAFYKERPDHIKAVLARIEAAQQELDASLERWMELESLIHDR